MNSMAINLVQPTYTNLVLQHSTQMQPTCDLMILANEILYSQYLDQKEIKVKPRASCSKTLLSNRPAETG
jgi:hypothetical protein